MFLTALNILFPGNRDFAKDDPLEFKSHQWFGASVRSKQDKILVSLYELPQVCGASLGGTQDLLYVQVGLAKGTRCNEITAMFQG